MIGWRDGAGALHNGSLFGAFAALARGEAWSFPALRPHQREAWHAFTVQIAAMALIRAGVDTLPESEEAWRELLVALSDGVPEAWELVVDDWSKPALLQPPIATAANRADYKNRLFTPDALDMLATAKNNDVKAERIAQASDEDWLFALITLQTSEGYGGAGNQGASRMNGGLSNRMMLGIRPTGGATAAFVRDVTRLIEAARAKPDERRGKLGLVWLSRWDGTEFLKYEDLDPLYVEVCRRVRLEGRDDAIVARTATSTVTRIAAKHLNGKTEDPWAPIKADESASVTAVGVGYRAMGRLLDQKNARAPLLAQLHPDDDRVGLSIVAAALVRGQGKTEGLHRRTIRTSRIEEIDVEVEVLDRIGDVAKARADEARDAGRQLRNALISLVQGGPEKARLDDDAAKKKVIPWEALFDLRIDRVFFDDPFWAEATKRDGDHRRLWREWLRARASEVFEEAAEATPRTTMRRVRARAQARRYLDVQMRKWLEEIA